ncbi:MAG TPA: thioredoxin domain-containing protein [Pyrinomonadaceae bacterium]|nr:thioredoxin domain-containing protein [Pyrinomonadaceae bacterium]
MKRLIPFLLIFGVAGAAAAWYFARSANRPPTTIADVSPVPTPLGPAEPGAVPPHVEGPADAPVTLEEFGDFQCPPCSLLHPVLKQMEREFGGRVRVIFREFPLVPTHEHALSAARAAEAAGLQGKFWPMHDMIYENQKRWNGAFDVRPVFEGYATQIGLDLERYHRDLGSDTVQRRITEDGKRARSLNVTGTPTVFLNGRELPFQSLAPEKLRTLIQAELNK